MPYYRSYWKNQYCKLIFFNSPSFLSVGLVAQVCEKSWAHFTTHDLPPGAGWPSCCCLSSIFWSQINKHQFKAHHHQIMFPHFYNKMWTLLLNAFSIFIRKKINSISDPRWQKTFVFRWQILSLSPQISPVEPPPNNSCVRPRRRRISHNTETELGWGPSLCCFCWLLAIFPATGCCCSWHSMVLNDFKLNLIFHPIMSLQLSNKDVSQLI